MTPKARKLKVNKHTHIDARRTGYLLLPDFASTAHMVHGASPDTAVWGPPPISQVTLSVVPTPLYVLLPSPCNATCFFYQLCGASQIGHAMSWLCQPKPKNGICTRAVCAYAVSTSGVKACASCTLSECQRARRTNHQSGVSGKSMLPLGKTHEPSRYICCMHVRIPLHDQCNSNNG